MAGHRRDPLASAAAGRRADWLNGLADRLKRLERAVEGLSLEGLRDAEDFITAATTATPRATSSPDRPNMAPMVDSTEYKASPDSPDLNPRRCWPWKTVLRTFELVVGL